MDATGYLWMVTEWIGGTFEWDSMIVCENCLYAFLSAYDSLVEQKSKTTIFCHLSFGTETLFLEEYLEVGLVITCQKLCPLLLLKQAREQVCL